MASHPLSGLRPGDRVRDYEVEGLLGQGGFGRVYKAYHPRLRRRAAIKVMSERPDRHNLARFEREAQAVAALRHPAILNVFDFGELDGEPFMVLEFMPNGSLAQRLTGQPLPPSEVLAILGPLADALDHAHRQGVIHRDVKPANVFLDAGLQPVLADFGLSRMGSGETITVTGSISGTPAYIAPEVAQGREPTAASDIYALAVMAFQLLTGELPFRSAAGPLAVLYQHINQPPPRASGLNASLPAQVDDVLGRGLAKRPDDRWPSARSMVRALAGALALPAPAGLGDGGAEPAAAATPRPAPAGALGGRRRALAGFGLSAVIVFALLAVLWQARPPVAEPNGHAAARTPAAAGTELHADSTSLVRGGAIHAWGGPLDPEREMTIFIQQANVNAPIVADFTPTADGSFDITGTVSSRLQTGPAALRACSLNGPQKPAENTCADLRVTIRG